MIKLIFFARQDTRELTLEPVYSDVSSSQSSVSGSTVNQLLHSPTTLRAVSKPDDWATFILRYKDDDLLYFSLLHRPRILDSKFFKNLKKTVDDTLSSLHLPADTLIVI